MAGLTLPHDHNNNSCYIQNKLKPRGTPRTSSSLMPNKSPQQSQTTTENEANYNA